MSFKLKLESLYKIYGKKENKNIALSLLKQRKTKEEIHRETGNVVGVNNVNLEVEEGEIFVIMGLSGSGKSTLLRCVNCLERPSSGTVRLRTSNDIIDMTSLNSKELRKVRQKYISMVFQHFGLFPNRTVFDNVMFGLEIQHKEKKYIQLQVENFLEMTGLREWKNYYPSQLSGGMRQRVGVARALVVNTDIILMDEPFTALDPYTKYILQDEFLKLHSKLNKTVLFVTHDLTEAIKMGNKLAIMSDGKVLQAGHPQHILHNPATEFVAKFVKYINPLDCLSAGSIIAKKRERSAGIEITSDADGSVRCIIKDRPFPIIRLEDVTKLSNIQGNPVVVSICEDENLRTVLNVKEYSNLPIAVHGRNGHFVGFIEDTDILAILIECVKIGGVEGGNS